MIFTFMLVRPTWIAFLVAVVLLTGVYEWLNRIGQDAHYHR